MEYAAPVHVYMYHSLDNTKKWKFKTSFLINYVQLKQSQ